MTLQEIEQIQPDENGIITVEIEGNERRFVKAKFISFLTINDATKVSSLNAPGHKKPVGKKRVRGGNPGRPKTKVKEVKPPRGFATSKPVIAIHPDGRKQPFPSCAEAGRILGIYKAGVTRAVNGKLSHVHGIKFKFAI